MIITILINTRMYSLNFEVCLPNGGYCVQSVCKVNANRFIKINQNNLIPTLGMQNLEIVVTSTIFLVCGFDKLWLEDLHLHASALGRNYMALLTTFYIKNSVHF